MGSTGSFLKLYHHVMQHFCIAENTCRSVLTLHISHVAYMREWGVWIWGSDKDQSTGSSEMGLRKADGRSWKRERRVSLHSFISMNMIFFKNITINAVILVKGIQSNKKLMMRKLCKLWDSIHSPSIFESQNIRQ